METRASENSISGPGYHTNPFPSEKECIFTLFRISSTLKHPKTLLKTGAFKTNFKTHRFEKVTFEGWIDDENEGL